MDVEDMMNWKTGVRNLIISIFFGIVLPIRLFFWLVELIEPLGQIFLTESIILNGVLFVIIYTSYGFFRKETSIRFFIGMGYLVLLLYFYTVGSNVFTMYLPHCSFATYCIGGEFQIGSQGLNIMIKYGYLWYVFLLLLAKTLNIIRHKVKVPENQEKTYEYRESEN